MTLNLKSCIIILMELSTNNHQHREFQILLASSILILGTYAFQDILFDPSSSSTPQNIEIFQLNTTSSEVFNTPIFEENTVEYTGVVAFNQNTNQYILQTTNGSEYIITSRFADFLELVGEKVVIGGNLQGTIIEVSKIQLQ